MMNYTIVRTTDYSLQDFVAFFDANHPRLQPALGEIASNLSSSTTITEVVYEYSSLDECQQPITMSALMLIPYLNGLFSAQRLWLENRATQSANKSVPTQQWNIGEAHVLTNNILVSPDLMSFGASLSKPICYCHRDLAARNSVDAVVAAQAILIEHLHLVEQPLPVFNSGHSQGGFDALAVHRYMETLASDEEKQLFPLVRTFCADGPYMPDVQTVITAAQEKYLYGAYMVLSAMSHLHYHHEFFSEDIDINDFLTDKAKELKIADTIATKEFANKDLVKMVVGALGMRTSALFLPEVYQPGGRIYEMMMRCSVAERLADGWLPAKPIYFYHAHFDECVPVECMLAVQKVWGILPNVTFEDDMTPADSVDKGMVHSYSGGVFHRKMLTLMNSL